MYSTILVSIITAYLTCKIVDWLGKKLIMKDYEEMTILVDDEITCGIVLSLNGRHYNVKEIIRVVNTSCGYNMRVTGIMKEII